MAGSQGHEPCPQVAQGGQGVSLRLELVTPVLEYCRFGDGLHLEFCWSGVKPGGWVRKVILKAQLSQYPEP